jgi:hypothetical protein
MICLLKGWNSGGWTKPIKCGDANEPACGGSRIRQVTRQVSRRDRPESPTAHKPVGIALQQNPIRNFQLKMALFTQNLCERLAGLSGNHER